MDYADMNIKEIEDVLKDYTCEFRYDLFKVNYFVYVEYTDLFQIGQTRYDFTRMVYFESEDKINEFYEKIGRDNFLKYFNYLYRDSVKYYESYDFSIENKKKEITNILTENAVDDSDRYFRLFIIRPFKEEDGKYKIRYIDIGSSDKEKGSDLFFESFSKARKAVEEIGEYEILKYYFGIDESLIKDKNDIAIDYLIEVRNNLNKLIERYENDN